MKKLFLSISLSLFVLLLSAQTIVFHENFDGSLGADSVTSSPSTAWAVSNILSVSPSASDSAVVVQGDTSSLITINFSTTGNTNVLLEFDHICKIEFFDAAEILVSANGGTTWTKLTAIHYLGTGQFGTFSNKFAAASYAVLWDASNPWTIPQNSWWVHETFDISSLVANTSNVKVMFRLRDGNNSGAGNNYGWLLDNIVVRAAPGELIPPVISLNTPILHDSVFFMGPFGVSANITDASGIDTALLIYRRNAGSYDTVGMVNTVASTFYAEIDTIPAFSIGDSVCYYITAYDNSPVHNTTSFPFNACKSFSLHLSPPPPGCTSPLSNFPFVETFDIDFITGSGTPTNPGVLDTGWTRTPSSGSTYLWLVHTGVTGSTNTGPSGDHTSGNGNYLYTEASYGSTSSAAELVMPCADITSINVPYLEFYYHMYGINTGELHVDIYYGGQWQLDVMPVLTGDQGNAWHKASINLSFYKSITQIRFRAIKGAGYASDIAIDDVRIWEPPAYDAGMLSIDAPTSPANTGLQNVKFSYKNFGSATLNKLTLNWQVNQVLQTPYVWTGTLMPGNVADSIIIGQYNFLSGPSTIKAWTSLPNDSVDGFNLNDTIMNSIIACTGPLRGTFVIGGANPDFATFTDALFAVQNCGVDSAIVFNVSPGVYVEQLDIDTVTGASITNTITFQSLSGDSTSVNLQFAAASTAQNFVVRFNGSKHFQFKNMTVQATGQSYGRVFVYENSASYNTVENCRIIMNAGAYSYISGFYFYNTPSSDNKIINNDIQNGYYSLYMRAPSNTTPGYRNEVRNNNFHGYYSYGAYIQYQDSLILESNTFTNDTTVSYCYSVYLYYVGGKFEVSKNRIFAQGTSSLYGLRLYYCNSTLNNEGIIANNMISLKGSSTNPYGIYCYNSNYVDFYHNTVNITTSSSVNSRAFYLSSGSNIKFKNNILSNMADGYTYYISTTTAITQADFNNLYTTGGTLAYWGGPRTNLSALQTAYNMEQSSISVVPSFMSNTNLHMSNGMMNFQGTPLASVTEDIDNEPRSAVAPAIGADEKPPIPFDAGVLSIVSPMNPEAEDDTVAVQIVLKNYGTDTLPAFAYSYMINNVAGPVQNYTAGMLPGAEDTLSFPDIIIDPGHNNICAFTTLAQDTNTFNDTVCKYFYGTPIIDMGIVEMITPDSGMCLTSSELLIVKMKNYGSQNLNMANNPVTIHTSITGTNTISVPDKIINTGIINVGQEQQITIINNLNMATNGQYHFNIWTSVNGDGDVTTDSMETKDIDVFTTVNTLPYYQDFENFSPSATTSDPGTIGEGWSIENISTNVQWYVGNGSTYTSNTGPSADHTHGSASGKYMYAEAYGYSSSYALFTSPCINISAYSHPTLRFWYHMYGANINSLRVDVLSNGQWYYSVGYVMGHHQNAQTDPWKQVVVDLSGFSGTIRFRFRAVKASGSAADIAIDDIMVYNPLPHDAGVAPQFEEPTINFTGTGNLVTVKIKIENLGQDTLTSMNVGYIAGNAVPVLENWTGTILPYGSEIYEFNTKFAAPIGEVNICAFTRLLNDNDLSNDTACMSFTGVPILPLPYDDDFEGTGYFVSSGGNMQWEKGTPTKNIFTSAHSPSTAWVTSLNDSYLNNSDDYLYTPFYDFSQVPNCSLSFYHRIDSEHNYDGGYIQYSQDLGQTWINLGYMGDPLSIGWYNSNIGGSHSWSGPDSNWRYSAYDLSAFNILSTPIQFRFGFVSNPSVNNYEGWMIDDMKISPPAIAQDAGVKEILTPSSYTTPSTTSQVQVRIKNYGTQTLTSIPLYYVVDNGSQIAGIWSGNLAAGASVDYTFPTTFPTTATYRIKTGTNLIGDTHGFNDTASIIIDKDVALTAVLLPQNNEVIGDTVQVAISLSNLGIDTIYSLNLEYDINSTSLVQETWNGSLAPGQSDIYYFNNYYSVLMGIYKICARVQLTGDTKASNDESCKYVAGVVANPISVENSFVLQQNQPNPFNDLSKIHFEVPYSGQVQVRIVDLFGKELMNQQIDAVKGSNTYLINASKFSVGVYFYEFEFDNMVQRRKMIIIE